MNAGNKCTVKMLAIALVLFSTGLLMSCSKSIDKVIEQMVIVGNKECPIAYEDGATRLDSMTHPQERTIGYSYTLLTMEKNSLTIDAEVVRKNLIEGIKTTPDIEILRKMNAIFRYTYYDKNGALCFSYDITPDQYK